MRCHLHFLIIQLVFLFEFIRTGARRFHFFGHEWRTSTLFLLVFSTNWFIVFIARHLTEEYIQYQQNYDNKKQQGTAKKNINKDSLFFRLVAIAIIPIIFIAFVAYVAPSFRKTGFFRKTPSTLQMLRAIQTGRTVRTTIQACRRC